MIIDRIRRITRDGRWIAEIDGLRFLAIFSVFLFHLSGEVIMRSGRIIPVENRYLLLLQPVANGDRGVELFFVISGMILAMPFARSLLKGAKKVSIRKYYMRRVTRLEPPYLVSVLLFLVLLAVYMHGHLGKAFLGHALASAFYLHGMIYGSMSPVNPVTWSLEIEIQFYLLAPLFMQLFRVRGQTGRRLIMVAGILLIGVAQAPLRNIPRVELSILFHLQYFLAGLLLADILVLDLERMRSRWIWDVAGFAALAFIFEVGHEVYAAHILLPFAIGVLCLAAMRGPVLHRIFANSWIAVTGGMCYSIYLMHFMLMAAIFKESRRLIVPHFDFFANYLIQFVALGIPILLLSAAFYLLVERPCMDPDWPSKLWHRVTGRSGNEVEALDANGISDDEGSRLPS